MTCQPDVAKLFWVWACRCMSRCARCNPLGCSGLHGISRRSRPQTRCGGLDSGIGRAHCACNVGAVECCLSPFLAPKRTPSQTVEHSSDHTHTYTRAQMHADVFWPQHVTRFGFNLVTSLASMCTACFAHTQPALWAHSWLLNGWLPN